MTVAGSDSRHEPGAAGILVIGSSHVAAIAAAWSPDTDPPVEFHNFWHGLGDETPFLERVMAKRAGRADPAHVVIVFGANNHNGMGFAWTEQPFAVGTVQGQVPPPCEGQTFIPRDVMRAVLRQQIALWRGMKTMVHGHFAGAAFHHVQGPPPVRDVVWEEDDPTLSEAKRSVLAMMSANAADPALRLALYHLQTDVAAEEATRLGAAVIEAPKAAMTPDGYLAPGFWAHGDPTHGNLRYGRLVLDQILARCGVAA